jgi:hypothetical protein
VPAEERPDCLCRVKVGAGCPDQRHRQILDATPGAAKVDAVAGA